LFAAVVVFEFSALRIHLRKGSLHQNIVFKDSRVI
jgi:hypothetical protein